MSVETCGLDDVFPRDDDLSAGSVMLIFMYTIRIVDAPHVLKKSSF